MELIRLLKRYSCRITVSIFLTFSAIVFLQLKRQEDEEMAQRLQDIIGTVPPQIQEDLALIRKKYMDLELEGNLRMQELLALKRKLQEKTAKESKGFALSPPGIHNLLPHLRGNKHALEPSKRVSKERRGVTLAFGIPTIKRGNTTYLLSTLASMISGLTPVEKNDTLIIIFIGERDMKHVEDITSSILNRFPADVESGLVEIIAASTHFYPNLDNLPSTFGDKPERVKWRAKQNLDYAFLMMYAQSRALFYVQMEDDVEAKPGYARVIKTFALQQETAWFMLEFSALGFIGKLFHSYDLAILVKFFLIFYKDKPNDWLLDHVFHVKACHPEIDNKHCNAAKSMLKKRYKPSLFQHVGKMSSLKGKKQLLVDKDFNKKSLVHAYLNPLAVVKTTFEEYKTHTAMRGYLGTSIFWALPPHKNSVLRMIFQLPHKVVSYRFKSGNTDHPGDILVNASIEILPEKKYQEILKLDPTKKGNQPLGGGKHDHIDESAYTSVGRFDAKGLAEGKIPTSLVQEVREVLIRVLYDVTHNWVIISEFFIEIEDKYKLRKHT